MKTKTKLHILIGTLSLIVAFYLYNPAPFNWTYMAFSTAKYPRTHVEDVDYKRSDARQYYGLTTNSEFLVKWASVIIPQIEYEGLTPMARYPKVIFFVPFTGESAIHVLGRYIPSQDVVLINDAFVDWDNSPRAARLLATLTHELIHAQGGLYVQGMSQELEARTEAATIEVLAGLCNYKYELACEAFWSEVHDYAMTKIRKAYPNYYKVLYTLLNNDAAERSADKSRRHWADNPDRLAHIIEAYTMHPWRDMILPAAAGDKDFNTGFLYWNPVQGRPSRLATAFDDIAYLLGWKINLLY